ncbi:16S rRNA (cytosine(1402)-N(4))-methyltransferase RsmH [Methyloceanibacter caenitepidi]|uniref:Ribosomal RNA small subunit methyltransferase H n=1 Tax=Methyloceanibacter caenitepidi TaxID=1384459 RepID=A0A0A8K4T3_9HYPH|nr:16S rRNA (cytosine(1402)-N(4))-methyltransferase RsmH [Methyloceanibacter caenitepidi]BAQ17024.1 rRNA small subunit methyltransferase H [Methyloceanibacter caenitepidi]
MMTDRGRPSSVAGGLVRHIPVLLSEVLTALAPEDGDIIIDGTFGAGGYSRAILDAADCRLFAIDRDAEALSNAPALASDFPDRFEAVLGRYSDMESLTAENGIETADGIVLDIGVSSMQLDQAERGFSFAKDGPLDMRMGADGISAADVVNTFEEAQIAEIIYVFGEERRSRAIAKAIVKARAEAPITRTGTLADIVAGVLGRGKDHTKHPATRTFQALRLYVNAELEELAAGLSAAERLLRPGGRLVVVTFHSLEDRIAKRFFASRSAPPQKGSRHLPDSEGKEFLPSFQLLNRRPVEPSEQEVRSNPRARSARLRAGRRTEAPAKKPDFAGLGVPELRRTGGA